MNKLSYLLIFAFGCSLNFPSADASESQAKQWATKLGYTAKAVVCAPTDPDKDGYVNCAVMTETTQDPIGISCGKGECKLQLTNRPIRRTFH